MLTVVIPSTNGFDKRYVSSNADETDGDKDRPLGSRSAWLPASLPFSDCQVKAILQVDTVYCSDQDYEEAEMIGGKLILHAAVAYKMIEGEKAELVLKLPRQRIDNGSIMDGDSICQQLKTI